MELARNPTRSERPVEPVSPSEPRMDTEAMSESISEALRQSIEEATEKVIDAVKESREEKDEEVAKAEGRDAVEPGREEGRTAGEGEARASFEESLPKLDDISEKLDQVNTNLAILISEFRDLT